MKRSSFWKRSSPPCRSSARRRFEQLETRSMMAVLAEGSEFLVNQSLFGNQQLSPTAPGVASDSAGNFLVTYDGFGDGDRSGIYVRRYDTSGAPVGTHLLANVTTSGNQQAPTAALADNGDFVVAWSGRGPGDQAGIFARQFTAGGASGEILVNATTVGQQDSAAIAMAADRSFVIAWSGRGTGDDKGIFLRRFSAAGQPLTGEIRVNSTTPMEQRAPSIAMADDGRFVVTWNSKLQDGSGWGVFAQRFNADGSAAGAEFRVNSTTAHHQRDPQAAMADDGRFVITWSSQLQDGSGTGIFAQRFAADGSAVGGEFQVNTVTAGNQEHPRVAMDSAGNFAITWTTLGQDRTGWNIAGQNFLADGTPDGGQYQVNGTLVGHQQVSSVAAADNGNLFFAWQGFAAGDGRGVVARRFVPDRDRIPPVITAVLANDTGTSASDRITRDPTINANIDDRGFIRTVRAALDSGTLQDVQIPADFRGPIVFDRARLEQINGGPLLDGPHTLRLQAIDEEGNTSSVFEFSFTLDSTAPAAPSSVDLSAASDTGISNTDNVTTDTTPTFFVQAESGQLVRLFVNGVFIGQETAVNDVATITSNTVLAPSTYTFTASAIDQAGNESPMSTANVVVTIDTTPPAAPTGLDLVDASDSGASPTDNLTNDSTPTIRVNTEAGNRVRLFVDGVQAAEATASASDVEITLSTPLSNGARQINAVALDAAGNISAFSSTLTINIDTVAPAAPMLDLLATSDTGSNSVDNVTRDTTPTIRVTTETGNVVQLFRNGLLVQEVPTGNVSFADITTPALDEGAHMFSALAIDAAGNTGAATNAGQQLQVVIDTLRLDLVGSDDTGANNADNLTMDNVVTLEITAPPLSMVTILIDGMNAGMQAANAAGLATFVTPPLSDGVHLIRVTAVDADGINRGPSAALAVTVDTAAPTIANPADPDPIDDVTVEQDAANTNIPLAGLFADVDNLGSVVRFNTANGIVDVQLYNTAAPLHVANFLNYVNDGDYNSTVFHRVVPGFVAQGGQQRTDGTNILTDPAVMNEFLISGSLGTLSLAKMGGDPNSGTSQFFFNLADNSDNLNNQNGGFTVFGQVLAGGMQVVSAIPQGGVVNSVTNLPAGGDRLLTFSIEANTNPSLVSATIANGQIVLDYQAGQSGNADITVRVADLAGNFVLDTFTVTVNPGGGLMAASADSAALDTAMLQSLSTSSLPADMTAVVGEAINRWVNVGLGDAGAAALANVSIHLADLPQGFLGYALGDTIWLDSDAAGHDWYIDPTPADDSEFVADIVGQLKARLNGLAADKVDLLSVIAHEFGHVLGLEHDPGGQNHAMPDNLESGVRWLPEAELIEALLNDIG